MSEHTSSLHEDKTKENLTNRLDDLEKFTLLNQLYLGQLLGNFQIKDQGRRCRFSGYVVDLDFEIAFAESNYISGDNKTPQNAFLKLEDGESISTVY